MNFSYDFWKALCVCIIIPLLTVTGCGAGSEDISYEAGLEEYSDEETYSENETYSEDSTGSSAYVYVCGRVRRAGVYSVSADSRVYEVLNLAGGVCEDADISNINQAMKIEDGQQIYVPSINEREEAGPDRAGSAPADDGLVNINSADATELMTLTGIGASRAQAIIDYRNENGSFEKAEDIMNVSGIKEGMFSKIKDSIKVR